MKLTCTLLGLFGAASAFNSLSEFGDGLYTVSAADGYPDFSSTIRIDNSTYLATGTASPAANATTGGGLWPAQQSACVRGLRQPVYLETRVLEFARADYDGAYANFVRWMEGGPGAVGPSQCKYSVLGTAAVGACSYGQSNPVCKDELDTAMRRADRALVEGGCGGVTRGCAVNIQKWRKYYCRLNVMETTIFGHRC